MSVQKTMNNLIISGDLNREALQWACAALHSLKTQGYRSINIDMRAMTKGFATEVLPFAARCRDLLISGVDTMLELPEDPVLSRLFKNSNWAYLIDPRQFDQSQYVSDKHIQAAIYSNADTHFQAVNQVVDKLLCSLEGFSRDQLAALEWAVNEITDNVLNHACSPIGGTVQLTTKSKSNIVEFVVCDTGVGIPKTLREAHPALMTDVMALDKAIREGVTRNVTTNMGNGLFGSFRLAQLSDGYFSIYSGYALLSFTKRKGLQVKKQTIPYSGAAIVCGISTAKLDILSEALSFRGQRYTPEYSYVDKLTEGGSAVIILKNESKSFGSRDVAKPVRVKIENLLAASANQIDINLDDVALISSSFADEVFGKLFAQLGPIMFMSRIKISGGSTIVRSLIDRAITQRLAIQR
jgi:anti-sigma regulatory factor (Ser/Thr protein kinase)